MELAIRPSELKEAELIFQLRSDVRLRDMQYKPSRREYPELYVELSLACADQPKPVFKCWTIFLNDEFCGHISETLHQTLPDGLTVSLGWNIVPEQWGKGVAPNAIRLFLDQKFDDDESVQFLALCFQSNSRCRRVLDKLGFVPELPSIREKLNNWLRTFGRQRLCKYRLTRSEWKTNHPVAG